MISSPLSLLWLRRDLRLRDHAALFHALQHAGQVQPVFIFDTDVLARFDSKQDRRLSFLADTLLALEETLQTRGGGLLLLHGRARDVIPKLAHALSASHLFAAEDYEPDTRERDEAVATSLAGKTQTHFVKDQVLFAPLEILKADGTPYKVYTPYATAWRAQKTELTALPYTITDSARYADVAQARALAKQQDVQVLDTSRGSAGLLEAIGYEYRRDDLWTVARPQERLKQFVEEKAAAYPRMRDFPAAEGTSRISPYLRFGLVSARECAGAALEAGAEVWLSELIWREFYAMILYHFPDSARTEWNPKYRAKLAWRSTTADFRRWQEGMTGYPLIDAAMRQLQAEGWMHNRARMIVASFLTKHLRIDWRLGEEHFAQYLMDYDLASNVGGWQWAASTGTDAQPYFRVFNPILQSEKFDPDGDYVRRYVPELRDAETKAIHQPWKYGAPKSYPEPIVDHATARMEAIRMFETASS